MSAEVQVEPSAPAAESLPKAPVVPGVSVDAPAAEPATEQLAVAAHDEIERLDPTPVRRKLRCGIEYDVRPLKLRQFLALVRILTRGASMTPLSMNLLSSDDGESFAKQFLMMLLFAVPEAEDESVDFVRTIAFPVLTGNQEVDEEFQKRFDEEMENPDLEDIVDIFQTLVEREAEDIRSLGNRLKSMLKVAEKMGLTPGGKHSQAASPAPST